MTVTSLSASAMSAPAIFGLKKATREITDSTERLSSGIRFTSAGDDVGGMSVAARLNGQLAGLRQAQMNNLQADSMLQTAYSAASTISDILDSMRILAVQANSGSLSDVERATLDVEFQALKEQMDSISSSTSFGDTALLDGTANSTREFISGLNNAGQASAIINITSPFANGETIRINNAALTAGTNFAGGASATDSATNLYNALSTSVFEVYSRLEFSLSGTQITVKSKVGGVQGSTNRIDDRVAQSTGAARFEILGGAQTSTADLYRLDGGSDNGFIVGNTIATGTIGDTLVNTHSQTKSSRTLTIADNSAIANGAVLLQLDSGTSAGLVSFTASTADPVTNTQFKIGTTAEETLDNLVQTVRNYDTATNLFAINQLDLVVTASNELTVRGKVSGALRDQEAVLINVVTAAGSFNMNNGTQTGVNTDNVINPDFVGTIEGFSATYVSNDRINASITVGDVTYTSSITDTTPASLTNAVFSSAEGGMFTVQLAAGGLAVANQTAADTYAARLDTAFSTLNFHQTRQMSSFAGTGLLGGANAYLKGQNFDDLTVNSITVTDGSSDGNASIEIDIEGEIYSTSFLGKSIGAMETITLNHETDANRSLTIVNGNNAAIDLSTEEGADTFAQSLRTNFGMDADGNGSLEFQVGSASDDIIEVNIGNATTDILFDQQTPDIITQENAEDAIDILDNAIDEITAILADIGSAQARLSYNYNANESAIVEIDTARAAVEDTDIAFESSAYAKAVVRQQAAVAVLAQTQLLNSSLLDLLKAE